MTFELTLARKPCECEFKGHAIIARKGGGGGGGPGTRLMGIVQVYIPIVQVLLSLMFTFRTLP